MRTVPYIHYAKRNCSRALCGALVIANGDLVAQEHVTSTRAWLALAPERRCRRCRAQVSA